jgi:hypothetical protein
MRPGRAALLLALCGGCSAQLSDARDPTLGGIDPRPDAGRDGGTGTGTTGDATAACTRRAVYLNFDGQPLTRGPSDATRNQASWMTMPQGQAPPYLDGDPGRDAAIQAIVDGVRAQLARFPIDVTRARPSAGDYAMIVFGGDRTEVGSRFGGAVNQLDCGDLRPSDVAWISDGVGPTQRIVNSAIGAIGFGLGLTATSDPRDCLCGWDNDCRSDGSAPCTLGAPIPRDLAANQLCPDRSPQDEVAAFRTAFCQ